APEAVRGAVASRLEENGHCGTAANPTSCESYCLCEIEQFEGANFRRCIEEVTTPSDIHGYCYVDPTASPDDRARMAAEQIVASCPNTQRRLLRFAGDNVPAKGAVALIACLGANVQEVPVP
ncbi:MAG TPA: hypothetical protein VIM73_07310, partial [Polyangiaceae bacterium]